MDKEWHWLLNVSEIQPGHSCVLGNNFHIFYLIHCVAILLILTSMVSCIIVIISITKNYLKSNSTNESEGNITSVSANNSQSQYSQETWSKDEKLKRKKRKMDFADRFPFYLAVADGLMGISHLTDHLVLFVTHACPEHTWATVLSINLWFCLGYQQLMHAGLALYTYLRVVKGRNLNLGEGEWKLQLFVITLMVLSILVFYPLGSFGSSGYWVLQDVKTTPGIILGFYVALSGTIQALCTTIGYRSIQKVVQGQKDLMTKHQVNAKGTAPFKNIRKTDRNSTASECLTTFVRIALCLYCPMALSYFAFVIQNVFGVIEPLTVLVIVVVANSSGWATALGYFHNRRIKKIRLRERKEYLNLITNSTHFNSSGTEDRD